MEKTHRLIRKFFFAFLRYWPFLFIFFLTFIFGLPFFVKLKIPFPADLLVGAYYPWLDYKWGHIVGVAVKNPLISDVFSQFGVWKFYGIKAIKLGYLPFWDWSIFNGMPFLATLHTGLLYPLNIIYFILGDFWIAHALFLFLQPLLAFFFAYLLFIDWNRDKFIASIGAISFAFSGFAMTWFEWGNIGHTLLWLPLLFWLTDKFFQKAISSRTALFVFIIVLTFSLTAGHIQTFFYVFLFWLIYFTYKIKQEKIIAYKKSIFLVLILISFTLINLFQLTPFFILVKNSVRKSEGYIALHNFGLFPVKQWLVFWAPDIFGNPTTYNYHGFWNYQEFTPFLGTFMFLFLLAVVVYYLFYRFLKNKEFSGNFIFFILSFLIILLMINPISGRLVYVSKIPLISTASASRLFSLVSFIIPSIFVLAFNDKTFGRVFSKYIFITATSWLVFILGVDVLKYKGISYTEIPSKVFFRNQFLPLGITLIALTVSLLDMYLLKIFKIISIKVSKQYFIKGILIIFLFVQALDLLRFAKKYNPFVDRRIIFPETPVIRFLIKNKNKGRILTYKSDPLLPHNTGLYYNLAYVDGYHPLVPNLQSSFINLVNNNRFVPEGRYGKIDNLNSPYLNYAALKYLLILKRTEKDEFSQNGKLKNVPSFYQKVFEDKTTVVLENKKSYPYVFFYDHDLFRPSSVGQIISYSRSINGCKIRYKSNRPGYLFISHAYSPYWQAKIDNVNKLTISKTKYIFMSVKVPAGQHLISLNYFPPYWDVIFPLSLFTLLLVFLFWIIGYIV